MRGGEVYYVLLGGEIMHTGLVNLNAGSAHAA